MSQPLSNTASTEYPEHSVFTKAAFKEACELSGVEAFDAHYPQWVEEKLQSINQTKTESDPDALIFNAQQGGDDLVEMDLNRFAAHLVAWHQRQKATVDQIMEVPEGQVVTISMPDGSESVVILKGDTMEAFKAGISMVMSLFGDLPFRAIPMEPENESTSTNPN